MFYIRYFLKKLVPDGKTAKERYKSEILTKLHDYGALEEFKKLDRKNLVFASRGLEHRLEHII